MNKLLTVVVPAYNAEAYLPYNLNSLCLGEVQEELEVLVIDDGSTDRTGEIADHYARHFPAIVRVIHKENGGHGSGINEGIARAAGRYFKVVDADDWVDKEAFLSLIEALRSAEEDAVVSGFYWVFDDGSGCEAGFRKKAEIKEPFRGVIYHKTYSFDSIADRIYLKMHGLTWKTELLRRIPKKIDEHCFYVDAEYILYPIPYVETVRFVPEFVYQYRIGREGQSVSPEKMRLLESHYDRVLNSLLQFYEACLNGKFRCSKEKQRYLASVIARIAAGKMKIQLSAPASRKCGRELRTFDQLLKSHYPEIYHSNQNWAVRLLRASRFTLYPLAEAALRMKHSFKRR